MGINLQKLIDLREKAGLTRLGLDKKAGLGWGTVRRAELGHGGITVETLQKLAAALDMPAAYFLE